jgi:hypothetical protein
MPAKTPTTKKGLSTALRKAKARLAKLAEAAKDRRAARMPKVYSQASWKGAAPKRLGVYYIRIMVDEGQVGGFGPYATVRAAAADAKNILRLNIGPGHKIVETGPVVPVIRSDERVKLYLHPESYSAQVAGKGVVSAQIIEIAGNDERLKSGDDGDLGTFGLNYNPRVAYEVEVMLRSPRTGVVKTKVVRVQSGSREAAAATVRAKYRAAGTLYDIGFAREALAKSNPHVAFKTRSGQSISFDAKRNPAYGGGMDESRPVVVEGVRGMKSTPFRKTFRNFAAYLKWSDSEAAGNYSVSHVYNA